MPKNHSELHSPLFEVLAMRQTELNRQMEMNTHSEEIQNADTKDEREEQNAIAAARHLVTTFTANKSLLDILNSLHECITWESKWNKPCNILNL